MPSYSTTPLAAFLRFTVLGIFLLLGTFCYAQETETENTPKAIAATDSAENDFPEISFLTCAPGHEIHRLYGHTALRIKTQDEDWAVNFGWFSFNTPNFVMKFILGLTDYSAAWQTIGIFLYDFCRDDMGVTEQCLNLTPTESRKIKAALWDVMEKDGYKTFDIPLQNDYAPTRKEQVMGANWTYRYNFLYDNCTTRVLDVIQWALLSEGERLVFPELQNEKQFYTQRGMIHEFTVQSPWYELGQDLMLGPEMDEKHRLSDMASAWKNWIDGEKPKANEDATIFLPTYAQNILEDAYVRDAEGNQRPLVTQTTDLTPFLQRKADHPAIPLTPTAAGWLLLAITALVSFGEWKARKKNAHPNLKKAWRIWGNALDIVLWTLMGGTGIILTILTGWSQHPAVDTNWLTFLFCPAFLIAIALRFCSEGGNRTAAAIMLAAATFTLVCHFAGLQWIPTAVRLFSVAVGIRASMALAQNVQKTPVLSLWKSWGTWFFILAYVALQLVSLRLF